MRTLSRNTSRILAFMLALVMLFTVTYRQADAATPSSTVSAKATLAYTLKNLKFGRAIQNFYIGSTYIYITQRKDGITYLSRLKISGNTATYVDHMTLNNFGHGQSLDLYTYNNENWFYIGCKADSSTTYYWSLQVARMKYEAGKTYDYTDMNRLSYMNYATKSSTSVGTTYRVAVGGNSTYTIFRVQTTGGTVTYSIYDTAALNKLLDASKSVQMNTAAARACCKYYFTQSGSGIVRPNGSFQGIDMTGLSNIYVSGGAHGDTPQIAKMNKSGSYLKLFKITNVGSLEIEGVQCKNDVIYFCIVPGTTSDLKKNSHKIYAIQESGTAPTLPTPVPTATPKPTVKATATPTVKPTTVATATPTAVPTPVSNLTLQQVLAGMTAINTYDKQNGKLPATATIGGITANQASYCRLACMTLANISSGNTTSSISYTACTEPAGYTNSFSSTTISQKAYLDAASRFLAYMNSNSNLPPNFATFPGANNISEYSGELSYDMATKVFVRALAYYAANGVLPASVSAEDVATIDPVAPTATATPTPTVTTTTTPTEAPAVTDAVFTLGQLTQAATEAVNSYVSGSPFYRNGITVNGVNVAQQNYYIMAAQAIQDIYNNKTTATYTSTDYNFKVPNLVANYDIANADGSKATQATQALYMNFAVRQTNYVNGAGAGTVGASAAYPTTDGNANGFAVSDYTGQMTYEAGLLMFSRVLASYAANGTLPASVELEYVPAEGTETTVAPATATPTATVVTTQAPATETPESIPTAHPVLDTVASGKTFTVAEIAAAAGDILSHYNAYSTLETEYSIPKAVKVGGYTITDDDWTYMAGYALTGLAGTWTASNLSGYTADTKVSYVKTTKPEKEANGTYEATEISLDKTVEIAWKTTNFANSNSGLLPASCASAFTGYQVSYYSGMLATARALNYYSLNGSLPATVEFTSLNYTTSDTDTNEAEATQSPVITEEPVVTAEPTEPLETDEPIPTEDVSEDVEETVEPDATLDPDATPVPENETYTRTAVLYAGYSIDKFVNNNPGNLPPYASINGINVYMPELLGVFARLIVDANNGIVEDIPVNGVVENETVYEQLTEGTLTKEQYVALAQEILIYMAENGIAPGYLKCDLGALSFNTLISVFAEVISGLRSTGELPATVDLTAWGSPLPVPPEEHALELARASVLYAANTIYNAVTSKNKYPNYATIDGEQVFMPELLGVLAQLIVNENDGLDIPVTRNDVTYAEKSYENITGTTLTKKQYVAAAQAVIDYTTSASSAAAPGFVVTEAGTLSYETLLKVFAQIGVAIRNDDVLPESVEVSAWTASTLPTPPQATETVEYQYLNFLGILKGARRVADAIEAAGNIPNYVTLDTDTRVLPGTMARLFAATVSNIYRGKAADMPLQEIATPKNIVSESLTAGTFEKTAYIKVAQRMAETIYANGAVPTYITTDLGTMNYCNVIYMYARVLEFYLTYGFLPDTIDVKVWGTYDFQA